MVLSVVAHLASECMECNAPMDVTEESIDEKGKKYILMTCGNCTHQIKNWITLELVKKSAFQPDATTDAVDETKKELGEQSFG